MHLICNWRSLEPVCTNSTRCCLSSAQVVSIQNISWSLDSVKNTEKFSCLCKRKCYSDFQTQNLFPSPLLPPSQQLFCPSSPLKTSEFRNPGVINFIKLRPSPSSHFRFHFTKFVKQPLVDAPARVTFHVVYASYLFEIIP